MTHSAAIVPLAGASVAPPPAHLVAGGAAWLLLRALRGAHHRPGQPNHPTPTAEPDQDQLTYREAMEYFVNQHPQDDAVVRGALLRRPEGPRFRVEWRFLDQNNNVCTDRRRRPYGRSVRVGGFDQELDEMFGGTDVIVFN